MKALYVNAITDGVRGTFDSIFGFVPEKQTVTVTDFLEPRFTHVLQFQLAGKLQGYFALSFPDETALKMVQVMTGTEETELSEIGISCLQELGNMCKGAMETLLANHQYACDITLLSLMHKEEVAPLPSATLVVETICEMGSVEFHYSIQE